MLRKLRDRLTARLPIQAMGALAGQVTLALSSFVLQVFASRELGPVGFGYYALLFGTIIMATALTTGLLGDSLTVLDRRDSAIRAGLFRLGWVVTSALALIGFGIAVFWLPADSAALFALAMAAFVAADIGRRLLMANLRFWSLVFIDSVGFVAMVAFLLVCQQIGPLGLDHFLSALAIGQLVAGVLAVVRLPAPERKVYWRTWGNWRAVLDYGTWRALQQFVRPTMLNAARGLVLLTAGVAAVGELEAARVFVAPAMLLVQGIGSYLFSSYAADRGRGVSVLLRRADRAATVMLVGAVVIGGSAGFLLPRFGWLLTDGDYQLSMVATLGWACYAASCAAVLPYGSLSAVQGKQRWVLLIRLVDSVLSLMLVLLVVVAMGASAWWTPWLLSIGSFVGGVLCRQLLLRPAARAASLVSAGAAA